MTDTAIAPATPPVAPAPNVTVLPYMGPPKLTEREQRRKNYKPQTVVTDGAQRTPARIAPDWRES